MRGVGRSQGPSLLQLSQEDTPFVGVRQLLHLNLALLLWTQPPGPAAIISTLTEALPPTVQPPQGGALL